MVKSHFALSIYQEIYLITINIPDRRLESAISGALYLRGGADCIRPLPIEHWLVHFILTGVALDSFSVPVGPVQGLSRQEGMTV